MKNKHIIIVLFVVLAGIQLYVPAEMIFENEDILKTGKEFRFKTRPIDPYDPFRGKYISLDLEESQFIMDSTKEWNNLRNVYVMLEEDSAGFAKIEDVSEIQPPIGDFLRAEVWNSYVNEKGRIINVSMPFERYYMEESKAYEAELAYRESNIDSTSVTYAVVAIKNGKSVLKDVMIDGESIKEVVLRSREE